MATDNKALFGRLNEVLLRGDLDRLPELAATELLESLEEEYAGLLDIFPDLRGGAVEQVAEGQKVATRWEYTGTHSKSYLGVAPTGKRITLRGILIDTVVEGRVAEREGYWNVLEVMVQLGLEMCPKRLEGEPSS